MLRVATVALLAAAVAVPVLLPPKATAPTPRDTPAFGRSAGVVVVDTGVGYAELPAASVAVDVADDAASLSRIWARYSDDEAPAVNFSEHTAVVYARHGSSSCYDEVIAAGRINSVVAIDVRDVGGDICTEDIKTYAAVVVVPAGPVSVVDIDGLRYEI